MVGIQNINISQRELNYYKDWVEQTQGKTINEYIGIIIKQKLDELKRQKGKCNQKSIVLEKGGYKGSCTWKNECNSYKIYLRGHGINIYYGFFESLYKAEIELKSLFNNDEQEIIKKARKNQEFHKLQNKYTTRPKITDGTYTIKALHRKKGSIVLKFKEPFINPETNKQQTQITFNKDMLKHFNVKQVIDVCIDMDDPIKILKYRVELKNRI